REPLRPMGWTTLQDLPEPLTRALRGAELGETIGPVESSLGWHLAVAEETDDRPTEVDSTARQRLGERLREFARWLDYQRGTHLRCAEGFEHPGDPSQPDNTHRH
ncbi:MAG TPA: hypothetical protein VE172_07365, partial [Stackebrandtia sp.]|uniref:peptidylprolyl isomerase n=1 Tax=Stackebrandtia sp. TaxID=2023065 RepID=UPI002D3ACFA1